jgi:hypothetical protein
MSAASSQKFSYEQSSDATAPDWAGVAAGAWEAPSWKAAAREYHEARQDSGGKPPQRPDPQLLALLDPKVSLERAWHELNSLKNRAASPTIEALMMGLRERGISALTEPKVRRRLSECDEQQVAEVGNRLQKLKPEVLRLGKGKLHRGWTAEEVEILLQTWGALR